MTHWRVGQYCAAPVGVDSYAHCEATLSICDELQKQRVPADDPVERMQFSFATVVPCPPATWAASPVRALLTMTLFLFNFASE
eukprot:2620499-Amphidinium_carterae.1